MKQKSALASMFGILMFFLLLLGFSFYYKNLTDRLEESTKRTLHEITVQQKFNVDSAIAAEIVTLKNISYSLSRYPENQKAVLDMLSEVQKNSTFDYLIAALPNGKGLLHDGREIDISASSYYQKVLAGETVLSSPVHSKLEGMDVIPIATPVMQEGELVGILVGSFTLESFERLILPSFDGKAYSFVVDQSGELIFGTHNNYTLVDQHNVLESWKKLSFSEKTPYDQVADNIAQAVPGTIHYGRGSDLRLAEYLPLELNHWTIIVAVPTIVIAPDAEAMARSTSLLIVAVLLCFLPLILYILWQQRQNTMQLKQIAYYDEFTGAPTLAKFKIEAERFLADRTAKHLLMAKFDIEQFKLINQILGDEVGDAVLKNLAKALEECLPSKYKTYARLHDDEFLLLYQYNEPGEIVSIRNQYLKTFSRLMSNDFQYEVRVVSGHYHMTEENCTNVSEAIEKANIAHRKAKQTGQEICIYDAKLIEQSLKRKEIEGKMRAALVNDEFHVYLQPKYLLETGEMIGAEALVRWVKADGAIISPVDFIPIFEQNGFVIRLDFYMFEAVCRLMRQQLRQGWKPVPISVNFSRLHLFDNEFIKILCQISDAYEIPHEYLELELTESVMFNQEEMIQSVLEGLHSKGFLLSMDDFGAGYSSLGLLKNLPVDIIKIDRSFFDYQENTQRGRIVLENVMQLAKKLGIYTVAEGVEKATQIELLREIGCDIVQGYYFARPMPAKMFFESKQ